MPTLTSKVSCNQRVFIAVNPGKKYTYAKYMWKMCVRIAMRYLCSIHIIDAYSSTTTRKMQVHQCIWLPFLGHLSPKVYTHYVCFPSFLFPGDLHDSLDILWQPLATCHQGEAMYIGGLGEGRSPPQKKFFLSLLYSTPF